MFLNSFVCVFSECGKALNERKAEIRIQFREPPNSLFKGPGSKAHNNELVLRIQPSEAVYLKMMCKMPGLEFFPAETELNLSYQARYPTHPPPEAYARLILDVLRGDQSQFVRSESSPLCSLTLCTPSPTRPALRVAHLFCSFASRRRARSSVGYLHAPS